MEFISQTSVDDEGNYTMTWKDNDGKIVKTTCNLFE